MTDMYICGTEENLQIYPYVYGQLLFDEQMVLKQLD